jgi:hypothetical protein
MAYNSLSGEVRKLFLPLDCSQRRRVPVNLSDKFSLVDFLAYLFPGVIDTLGLYTLLLLTPLHRTLVQVPIDLATGILLLTVSYVIGVVLSGFSEIIVRFINEHTSPVWVKETIPIDGFKQSIVDAFDATFGRDTGTEENWTGAHFYMCRSMVLERMPGVGQLIQRQTSLRELRLNLLPAATIWLGAGIGWGIRIAEDGLSEWGYILIVGSVSLWVLIVLTLFSRMRRNEHRETREVLTAFLAGHKSSLFEDRG